MEKKWFKMAMDVGFEKNCPDIKYAIGGIKKLEERWVSRRSYGGKEKWG
ncbi:hypothetical protein DE171_000436 [Clostridium beijerinckii]|nr:hypothetical protein [Clostridium beijerinckii]